MINFKYIDIWEQAKPYLNIRRNDKHTWYCYYFAEQLCEAYPEANRDIVLPTILLHDVGWSTVPKDKIYEAFGPNMLYPELRRQHETEGVRIAGEILRELEYDDEAITEITSIIDGHDTRKESLSLHDSIVRDADKLWRYTPFGLATVGSWFNYSVHEQMLLLHKWIDTRFFTDAGREMARGLYAFLVINNNTM